MKKKKEPEHPSTPKVLRLSIGAWCPTCHKYNKLSTCTSKNADEPLDGYIVPPNGKHFVCVECTFPFILV